MLTLPVKGAGIVPDEWSTELTSLSLLSELAYAVFIQIVFSPYKENLGINGTPFSVPLLNNSV